ncbi:MAG: hypothetical protein QM727_13440 [Niabella sp.]
MEFMKSYMDYLENNINDWDSIEGIDIDLSTMLYKMYFQSMETIYRTRVGFFMGLAILLL